jgi:hypothetical protein
MATIYNQRVQMESKIKGLERLVEKLKAGECLGRPDGHDMPCGEGPEYYKKYCSETCRLRAELKALNGED